MGLSVNTSPVTGVPRSTPAAGKLDPWLAADELIGTVVDVGSCVGDESAWTDGYGAVIRSEVMTVSAKAVSVCDDADAEACELDGDSCIVCSVALGSFCYSDECEVSVVTGTWVCVLAVLVMAGEATVG